jgi:DNA-binding beta-propeller fold protein YncE
MKSIFILALLWISTTSANCQRLTEEWRTDKVFKSPESVLYDAHSNKIFVSNINGNSGDRDGNGFISKLNADGSVKKLYWVSGLNAPKGMAILKNKLYIADIDTIVVINIKKSKVEKKYHVPGAVFLNDVAAARNGDLFISDSRGNKIYRLKSGKVTTWIDDYDFERVNGLFIEKDTLFTGSNVIHKINTKTKQITVVQDDCGGIDGLEKDSRGNFIFSNWVGRIFYRKDNGVVKLLDCTEKKINTADISFARKLNLLLVPTFLDNRLIAYRLN